MFNLKPLQTSPLVLLYFVLLVVTLSLGTAAFGQAYDIAFSGISPEIISLITDLLDEIGLSYVCGEAPEILPNLIAAGQMKSLGLLVVSGGCLEVLGRADWGELVASAIRSGTAIVVVGTNCESLPSFLDLPQLTVGTAWVSEIETRINKETGNEESVSSYEEVVVPLQAYGVWTSVPLEEGTASNAPLFQLQMWTNTPEEPESILKTIVLWYVENLPRWKEIVEGEEHGSWGGEKWVLDSYYESRPVGKISYRIAWRQFDNDKNASNDWYRIDTMFQTRPGVLHYGSDYQTWYGEVRIQPTAGKSSTSRKENIIRYAPTTTVGSTTTTWTVGAGISSSPGISLGYSVSISTPDQGVKDWCDPASNAEYCHWLEEFNEEYCDPFWGATGGSNASKNAFAFEPTALVETREGDRPYNHYKLKGAFKKVWETVFWCYSRTRTLTVTDVH